ncbi:MAG: hypothetical protein WCW87_02570 [Candidatus Paceibacterota bacterium]
MNAIEFLKERLEVVEKYECKITDSLYLRKRSFINTVNILIKLINPNATLTKGQQEIIFSMVDPWRLSLNDDHCVELLLPIATYINSCHE